LDEWRFLVGEWRGTAKDQYGEKGTVESVFVFSSEPSEKFIMGRHESRCEGRLVNRGLSLLFYDRTEGKFKRKSFYSYGFVNNEVELSRDEDEIKFEVNVEPVPKEFERISWRSYMRKISENKVAMGLEMAKEGKEFQKYGETVYTKTSQQFSP